MQATTRAAPAISRAGSGLPSRVVVHAVEGAGKTSFAAHGPEPIFSMTRGETGLLTLIDNGLVPAVDHFEETATWADLLWQIRHLTETQTAHRMYAIDTLNGAQQLCFEHVTRERFHGSTEKFLDYGKGAEVALDEWNRFLVMLDQLRARRKMAVMLLCHTKVKTFKNPEGDDYDRYTPDMHEKVWGLTHKWGDYVLFVNFETFAKKERGALRAKGVGSDDRIIYTSRTAAYDAKNRNDLPAAIRADNAPDGCWRAFSTAVRQARLARQQSTQQSQQAGESPEGTEGKGTE